MPVIRPVRLLTAFVILSVFFYVFQRVNTPYSAPPVQAKVHWTQHDERFPVESFTPLPTWPAVQLPTIQHSFEPESEGAKKIRLERRAAVEKAFEHAWDGYKAHAWGQDEVAPVTGRYRNAFGGWGATLVDTMDTLWMMDMKDDFEKCVQMVEKIDFTTNDLQTLNVFETTIRYLGGLLAAYDLSDGKYEILLQKAVELGDILYSAFDTPNRMPVMRWHWQQSAIGAPIEAAEGTLIAEVGSLSLEFTRLSQLTKDPKYYDAIARITDELDGAQSKTQLPGLWPVVVNSKSLTYTFNFFTLGGMADSMYEYLPKQFLLLGGRVKQYQKMYEDALEVARKHLFFRPRIPTGQDVLFAGNAKAGDDGKPALDPQGQHLTCFIGGMVGLGAKLFNRPDDMKMARQLAEGCIWAYKALPSGLMPETFHLLPCQVGSDSKEAEKCDWDDKAWHDAVLEFNKDPRASAAAPPPSAESLIQTKSLPPGFTDIGDARYILRPEAMETLFILYRLTGDTYFQDAAWDLFQSIVAVTKTQIAHAGVHDVRKAPGEIGLDDRMESFWTAETLKYAYLAFEEPSVVDLDKFVLNTEAHPLRIGLGSSGS